MTKPHEEKMNTVRIIVGRANIYKSVDTQIMEMLEFRKTRVYFPNGDAVYFPHDKAEIDSSDSDYLDIRCDKEFALAHVAAEYIAKDSNDY